MVEVGVVLCNFYIYIFDHRRKKRKKRKNRSLIASVYLDLLGVCLRVNHQDLN
jgi:hypothetical protein